jgi:hypothetical protein
MLLKSLTKYQPANLVVYLVFGILLWIRVFLNSKIPGIYIDKNPMPVYSWIVELIGSSGLAILCKFLAFTLILLQGLLYNGIINQYNLLGTRSYLPGIIYLIITANFPENQILHPIYFSTLLLILSWNRLINIDLDQNTLASYFNASLLLGISTIFYPNYIYFIIIVFASTSLNRPPSVREFIMIVTGFVSVWYFYFSLFFIFTNHFNFSGLENDFYFGTAKLSEFRTGQIIFLIYFAVLLIFASVKSSRIISNQKIQTRRNQKILFLWFLLGFAIYIFTNSKLELIYLLAIPISFLFSLLFSDNKNLWIKEIAFDLLIGITIINQFFPNLIP